MFRCKRCGHVLTKEEITNAHYSYPYACHCPSCHLAGEIVSYETKMELSWNLKVLIDIAFNFGVQTSLGTVPHYSEFDYYEELLKLANKFLNTPAPADSLYVMEIDKFAQEGLTKLFGGTEDNAT